MTTVLSAVDPLRKERHMSLDDNYSTGSTDWRVKYNEVVDMLAETKAELDEFHHASKELEAELESELQRTERAQQDLKVKVSRAESERDEWKSKFMSLQTTHNTTTTSLQRELDKLRQEYQQTKIQLRELEMGNDDLERNERAVSSSLADMEAKYSRALEEKILLEQELLEKANLEEETQRLKDELRDANEEISILKDQLAVAAERNVSQSIKTQKPPSDDDLLRTAPPSDLELSELSPSSESLPSQNSTPKASTSTRPTPQSAFQRVSLYNKDSPLSAIRAAGFSRSSTLASFYSPITPSSRAPNTRATPIRSSTTTSSQATTSTTSTTSKNKGVQMVSEMRARVRNLEQKIHTRVPRLRMASITGRPSANVAIPPVLGTPSGSSSSAASNASTGKTSWESQRKSVDSRTSSDSFDTRSRKDFGGDSSGWVLIMEESPSPQKDKERERQREKRRLSNPAAPTAFRPTVPSNRATSPSLGTGMSNSLAQSVMNTGLRRPQSRLSGATSSTATTGSSIPTPTSRPTTPIFLPLPAGGLHAPTGGLKRSTGPNAPNPYNQTKRSSLGTSTMGPSTDSPRDRPITMAPLPRSNLNNLQTPVSSSETDGKSLPQIPGLHANVTMRPPKLPSTSNLSSVLSKSRIGRPSSSSGRKSAGDANGALDVKDLRPRAGSSVGTFGK